MKRKRVFQIAAVVFGLIGAVVLGMTLYPLLSYELTSREKFPSLISPLVEDRSDATQYDYTKASNWFIGGDKQANYSPPKVAYYTLTIPRLRIENATVTIGGEDLSESLIQYPGTALPGKRGNSVIFGHSILPSFYDPTDYIAIFSTLPTLEEGDEMYITYDGLDFTYVVEDMFEVYPTDIQVLEQNTTDSFVTLVTCTPPGHPQKPKRLIVRARVIPPEQANANTRT
ncbi:sortase [Patescibacteria group bacterium]